MLGIGIGLSNRSGGGGDIIRARPSVGAATWTGYAPGVSGVTQTINPAVGAATWTGPAPAIAVAVTASPSVGAATWTGPAPTVTGLVPDGAVISRAGDEVISRAGANVVDTR